MRIKDEYVLRRIADENIVIAVGEKVVEFSGMIAINDTTARIWEYLCEERTFDEVLGHVLSLYDIDEETAKSDLAKLIAQMEASGVLEQ